MKKISAVLLFSIMFKVILSQPSTPNSFLGIILGTKTAKFLSSYSDAQKGNFWSIHTNISAKGMVVYSINRKTQGGDNVKIDCCFYDDILSVIDVKYSGYQSGTDMLDGLEGKYGTFSNSDVIKWRDVMNGQYRTTSIVYWNKPSVILNFVYTDELGSAELLFADKAIQQKLREQEQKKNVSKIE